MVGWGVYPSGEVSGQPWILRQAFTKQLTKRKRVAEAHDSDVSTDDEGRRPQDSASSAFDQLRKEAVAQHKQQAVGATMAKLLALVGETAANKGTGSKEGDKHGDAAAVARLAGDEVGAIVELVESEEEGEAPTTVAKKRMRTTTAAVAAAEQSARRRGPKGKPIEAVVGEHLTLFNAGYVFLCFGYARTNSKQHIKQKQTKNQNPPRVT